MVIARLPLARIQSVTCSACSMFSMSFTATSAPSSAKISAIPRPMPRPAPVINAILFFNLTRTLQDH
jgi:hypothetical protein